MKSDISSTVRTYIDRSCFFKIQQTQVVYQLVFANNRNISHAAGEFLHKKLLTEDLEEVLKEHRAQRHTRKIREPHIILKELLRFFLENEVRR